MLPLPEGSFSTQCLWVPMPPSTSGPGFSLRMQMLISQTCPKHISSPASGPAPLPLLMSGPKSILLRWQ